MTANRPSLLRPSLHWLLVFLPLTIWAEHAYPESHRLIFFSSCLAIIPLAGLLGHATEQIAARAGEGLGGFLNATFGNAAELIIALVALKAGQLDVVKASLTGSIIGNVLLVLGASFLAGGFRHRVQQFNVQGAEAQAASLAVAAVALIVPSAFYAVGSSTVTAATVEHLSLFIAALLLVVYLLSLVFTLRTHRELFTSAATESESEHNGRIPSSIPRALLVLLGVSALIAWMSEILVGSVEQAAAAMGMSEVFVGIIVVAIVGNAAEHSTAILMAIRNRMDLSLGIAIGSSIQIALFVAPLLVIVSYAIAPSPMDLVFSRGELIAVVFATYVLSQAVADGTSTWFKGVQLLAVYAIIGIAFYFVP
jgi:Ca2+:H+ antiporter